MDPALITAWATVAVAASAVVGDVTCFLIWRGLRAMDCSSDERARDRKVTAKELRAWRETWKPGVKPVSGDMRKLWREFSHCMISP